MFICEKCLEKYNNLFIGRSYGKCEMCGEEGVECGDIPSSFLSLKEKVADKLSK